MWIRAPSCSDMVHVTTNMRDRDAAEVFALRRSEDRLALAYGLYSRLQFAQVALVAGVDSQPDAIAFLGIWAMEETGGLACANLFATAGFPSIAGALVRHVRRSVIPTLLRRGCRRVECRASATYRTSRRFIRACGAVEECELPDYGKNRETFVLCAWTRSNMERRGYVPRLPDSAIRQDRGEF